MQSTKVSPEMAKLRAGIIGLGVMGQHHLRVLTSLADVELVGFFDSNQTDSVALSNNLRASNLDDLLSRDLDYCVVAAPTSTHLEISKILAEKKIHALIEKPLAPTSQDAFEIARLFQTRGLIGAVGHIERYNPALQEAKKKILAGEIGRVHQIATRRQGPFPTRITDVGVVMDLATHDIDLTSWLIGEPYRRISAQLSFQSGREHEDFVASVGLLSNGTITSHLVNWLSPIKERTTIITGEEGALVADTLMADLTLYRNGAVDVTRHEVAMFRGVREGDVIRFAIPKPEPLILEHQAYRDAILGMNSDIVSMQEGVKTIRVAEAMLESHKSGSSVSL